MMGDELEQVRRERDLLASAFEAMRCAAGCAEGWTAPERLWELREAIANDRADKQASGKRVAEVLADLREAMRLSGDA